VVLAFDSDAAGTGAALRGFDRSVPGDLDLRMAQFPDGRDPADLLQEGLGESLITAVEASVPLLQFRIDRELDGYDMAEPEAKVKAATAAARLIRLHPDSAVRSGYVDRVARKTGVDRGVITRAAQPEGAVPASAIPVPPQATTAQERAERELLRLVLANDPGVRRHDVDAEWFAVGLHRAGFELVGPAISALPAGESPNLGRLLDGADDDLAAFVRRTALDVAPLGDADDVVRKLRLERVEAEASRIHRAIEAAEAAGDTPSQLLGELMVLQRERDRIRSASVLD
jgi:DNA primase